MCLRFRLSPDFLWVYFKRWQMMACSLTIKWQMIKGRIWSVCQAFVEGPFFGRLCRKHFNMVSHTSPHLCLLKTYQKLGKAGWMAAEDWPSSMCLHKENSWVWTEGRKDYHGPSHCSCEENSKTALAVLTLSGATPGEKRHNMLRPSFQLPFWR